MPKMNIKNNLDENVEINKEEKISKNEINNNPENENINNDKIEEKSITDNSKKNGQNTSHDLLLVDKNIENNDEKITIKSREEKIAKLAVYSEVKFPKNIWEKRSNEVIDLIKRCLIKEPKFRIKIDDILNHEWIKKYNSND